MTTLETSITYAIACVKNAPIRTRWRIVSVPAELEKTGETVIALVEINDRPATFSSRRLAEQELARIVTSHDVVQGDVRYDVRDVPRVGP